MNNTELIKLAIEAKKHAHVPFSNYKVGAILVTKNGKIYEGANMEWVSCGMTICAERVALVKALYDGEKEFEKIVVVGGNGDELTYTTPCGVCRQFLSDFGTEIEVVTGYMEENKIEEKVFKLKDLLPETFVF